MKHKLFLFLATIFLALAPSRAFASVNDFYFSSAKFDYYLEKNADNTSHMRVEEVWTAVYPATDQNHGFNRCIPTYYRGVKSLNADTFLVERQELGSASAPEDFSIYKDGALTCFRIGNANVYVHGTQTYTLSYSFDNVILAPDNSPNQELYWDTNGTEGNQSISSLTATVHLSPELSSAFLGETSCYVGALGASGTEATSRCSTSKSGSVITFSTSSLSPRENLTLDLAFSPDTFVVPAAQPNYLLYILLAIFFIFIIALFVLLIRAYQSVSDKRSLANDPARPVQYLPPKGLSVAESAALLIKPRYGSSYVATLLELAVSHKIELEKTEPAKKLFAPKLAWKIHIKSLAEVSDAQKIVLELLNHGAEVHEGDVIKVKNQSYSSKLSALATKFTLKTRVSLETKGLFEPKKTSKSKKGKASNASTASADAATDSNANVNTNAHTATPAKKSPLAPAVVLYMIFFCYCFFACFGAIAAVEESDISGSFQTVFYVATFVGLILTTFIFVFVSSKIGALIERTREGIEMSRYLDGLEEYMKLAEADRIKFLHSVSSADVSNQGIVKLYEKLLPYAIIFRIEDSWMEELNRYYKLDDVNNPDWMLGAAMISSSDFHSFSTATSNSISSASASSSSGSSGGGGGGSSGGGGGGGGTSGW